MLGGNSALNRDPAGIQVEGGTRSSLNPETTPRAVEGGGFPAPNPVKPVPRS